MGLDYSFEVYVHRRAAGRFLENVAALCEDDRRTTVILPDGASVTLPGTCGFEAGRTVDWADLEGGSSRLDLAPCFPGSVPCRVAYTYLMVFDGSALLPEHVIFDFTPATSAQSRLFLSSPSIRTAFADLASSVAAPLCLLDVEESHKIVVTAQDRRVSTRVPGPCVLWDVGAPDDQAYRELMARLDSATAPMTSQWIVDPDHPTYETFAASLALNSQLSVL